jgi:hypothetical protein
VAAACGVDFKGLYDYADAGGGIAIVTTARAVAARSIGFDR